MLHSVNDNPAGDASPPVREYTDMRVIQGNERWVDTQVIDTAYTTRVNLKVGVGIDSEKKPGQATVACYSSDNPESLSGLSLPDAHYTMDFEVNMMFSPPEDCARFLLWRIHRRTDNDMLIIVETHVRQVGNTDGLDALNSL